MSEKFDFFDSKIVLTQQERPDRLLQFQQEAQNVGLNYDVFYSLKGMDSPHDPGRTRFDSFCKSQIGIINLFLESGKYSLLAMEDDCVFKDTNHLQQALNELPEDWDIVYLGANVLEQFPVKYSQHLRKVKAAWTTHCIGYSRKMAEYISKNYIGWEATGMYDDWISRCILPNFNCFVIAPMVAWQRPVYSDLWQQNVSYGWQEIEKRLL